MVWNDRRDVGWATPRRGSKTGRASRWDRDKMTRREERNRVHGEVCTEETKNEIKTLLTRPASLEMSITRIVISYPITGEKAIHQQ